MLRSGKVVAAENGVLEVCFERPEACAHCGQCGGQKEETFVKIPGSAPVGRWIDVYPGRAVVTDGLPFPQFSPAAGAGPRKQEISPVHSPPPGTS